MKALRDYQYRAIQNIYRQWHSGKRSILLAMPTGSGKTRTFSEIALHFVQRREQVLLLVHREELLLQSQQTLEQITGQEAGLIKSGQPLYPDRLVQCASVQTLVKRLEQGQLELPDVHLVIVDEAHLSLAPSYVKILSYFPYALVLGVTATPCRLDGQGFDELYQAIVLGPTVAELIQRGYLADYDVLTPESFLPTEGIRITGGDFNAGDLADRLDRRYVAGRAVDAYRRHARGKRCVVFAINIDHSKAIAESYQNIGIPAEHIDGETPTKERQAILERFRNGTTRILTNVNLFTEGFDLPEIEVVQLCRPTQSIALHLQMVGRGLRPKRGRKALVLDHAGNCLRLGGPKAQRRWTLQSTPTENEAIEVIAPAPMDMALPGRSPELPLLPKRQVEIFETVASMHYLPTTAELETQLAQAAYRKPQTTAIAPENGIRSEYAEPSHSQMPSRRVKRRPATRRVQPAQPRKPSVMRQIGKAALELAELLEGILKWVRSLWSPPPQRRRPRRRRRF